MPLSPSEIVQLTVILLLATGLFVAAYSLPQKVGSTALLVMIPFQPVMTRFATANVLLTFVIFLAMVLRRGQVRLPMLPQFLLLLFCYLLSMSMVHKALYVQHAVYMVAVLSAILVFWIAYDLTYRYESLRNVITVFIVMNIAVVIYSLIQLYAGPGQKVTFFGIQEMNMIPSRWDKRLTGPFLATGVTSEFFVIMTYLIIYRLLFERVKWIRTGLMALLVADLGLLIATGNRGGFLVLIGGGLVFLWLFRRELGAQRVVQLMTAGVVMLSLASAIVINYTDFDRLYSRLGDTTFEDGIPDTRQNAWPKAWARVKESPVIGHGPRFQMDGGVRGKRYPGYEFQNYPHNLYLFLLATIGVVGLIAFMVMIATPLVRCWRVAAMPNLDIEYLAFAKTGVVIMIVFLVDQLKIEFMRIALVDYWHFIFALLGIFIAACDQAATGVIHTDQPAEQAAG